MKKHSFLSALIVFAFIFSQVPTGYCSDQIPVTGPVHTITAGNTGRIAVFSVVRIITENGMGTGFFHKSGKIITAEHVVSGLEASSIIVMMSNGSRLGVTEVVVSVPLDLALLTLEKKVEVPTLTISNQGSYDIGAPLATWGFPDGYRGILPLLTVGYLSGIEKMKDEKSGTLVSRWVVNAAFNSGNSGGPLLSVSDGSVVGVVQAKLAPISDEIQSAMEALKNTGSGMQFPATLADGSKTNYSEAQVVEKVLRYLRSQTQLVIGYAAQLGDLRQFLTNNGLDP